MTEEVWYRYYETHYHPGVDEWDNPLPGPGRTQINCVGFKVLKHTPKGVIIDDWGDRRFVKRDARKRYACPTKKEALESMIARKNRQISILNAQAAAADRALALAKREMEKLEEE